MSFCLPLCLPLCLQLFVKWDLNHSLDKIMCLENLGLVDKLQSLISCNVAKSVWGIRGLLPKLPQISAKFFFFLYKFRPLQSSWYEVAVAVCTVLSYALLNNDLDFLYPFPYPINDVQGISYFCGAKLYTVQTWHKEVFFSACISPLQILTLWPPTR